MRKHYRSILILAALLILIQLFTAAAGTKYYLTQLTMAIYYTMVALGLAVLMGYAGQISLGQAGFFAVGGYISARLCTLNFADRAGEPLVQFLSEIGFLLHATNLYGEDQVYINPWPAFLLAILITIVLAVIIGAPVLKLKGHYRAMATLGFGIIIHRIVLGSRALGEADGISNVPSFTILPGIGVNGNLEDRILNYYIAAAVLVIGLVLLLNLLNSRAGRALRSLHGDEEAARSMGINTARYKLSVFVLAAVFAAVAGVFLTHYNGGIGPTEASSMRSVRYVAIVAVGGMANIWGTLTAGMLLTFLSLRGVFGHFDDAVFGLILVVVMLFSPEGILAVAINSRLRRILERVNPFTRLRKLRDKRGTRNDPA